MSAFQIRPDEPLAAELARVMRVQLDRADRRLDDWSADPEDAFHETRRRLKKVRAAARIARAVDAEAAKAINAESRDAARALGASRDADVLRAAAEALAADADDDQARAALSAFARRMARTPEVAEDRTPAVKDAQRLIARAGRLVNTLDDAPAGAKALKRAAKRIMSRADEAFAAAHDASGDAATDEEHRHEWRKRVKDAWYAARLLRTVWPLARSPRPDLANELGKQLGAERDLLLLGAALKKNARACGGAASRDAAVAFVEARRAAIVATAYALGCDFHRDERAAA